MIACQEGSAMIDTNTARMLAHYKAWADKVMFDGVAALPPGEAGKERKTLFKTMMGTLNHIYVVDLIWQAHLEGRDHGFKARNVVVHPDLSTLRAAQEKVNDWIIDWAKAQTDATLDEEVRFTFVNGNKATMKRSEIFLHLVTHGSYHRGWVAEMFFEAGARPPQPDLSVFLCEAPQEWRNAL
jgi:uncharacterized damage-inducible protein DinB